MAAALQVKGDCIPLRNQNEMVVEEYLDVKSETMVRWLLLAGLLAAVTIPGGVASAQAPQTQSSNMRLVGYSDLQGRPAYQPTIHKQGNRWIAYIGLHQGAELNPLTGQTEGNGTMIVDVTDPRNPVALAHIPGDRLNPAKETEAQMVRACDIAGGTYILRDSAKTRVELWDVTDPAHPKFASTVVDGMKDTHKNWWECDTGIAYLPVWDPKWRNRMTKIYNLANPANPILIRDFGLIGQEPGSTAAEIPAVIHGQISYQGRVYFAYGSSNHGVLQVTDREKLVKADKPPTPENLLAPQIGRLDMPHDWGFHTAYPLLRMPIPDLQEKEGNLRDFLVITAEETAVMCQGPRQFVFFVDITDPSKPFPVSNFGVPQSKGDFCDKGGRFGPHSIQESFGPIFYKRLIFVSYFNAGVRAVDVRDPFHPAEVGYYIPETTEKTKPVCVKIGGQDRCKTAIQTNNVEVDDRGYVYIVDRAGTGLHILEVTGEARAIANFQ